MNNLKELLQTLSEKEAEAAIEPTQTDPRVRAGVEALVRNAKAELGKLQTGYKDAVMSNVVIIGVTGKSAKEFADAAEKVGSLAVDFDQIVDRLATNVVARGSGDIYTSHAHFMLLDELSKVRLEYDIVQLPTPMINAYSDGIYNIPVREAISKLLLKNYGGSLQSAVTRRVIGNLALAARFSGKKLPVVVYNLNSDVDVRFIPAPATIIESNGKVTEALVKKKLTEIKSLLSDKKDDSQTSGLNAQTQEET
jgi:hypothetical protein